VSCGEPLSPLGVRDRVASFSTWTSAYGLLAIRRTVLERTNDIERRYPRRSETIPVRRLVSGREQVGYLWRRLGFRKQASTDTAAVDRLRHANSTVDFRCRVSLFSRNTKPAVVRRRRKLHARKSAVPKNTRRHQLMYVRTRLSRPAGRFTNSWGDPTRSEE